MNSNHKLLNIKKYNFNLISVIYIIEEIILIILYR